MRTSPCCRQQRSSAPPNHPGLLRGSLPRRRYAGHAPSDGGWRTPRLAAQMRALLLSRPAFARSLAQRGQGVADQHLLLHRRDEDRACCWSSGTLSTAPTPRRAVAAAGTGRGGGAGSAVTPLAVETGSALSRSDVASAAGASIPTERGCWRHSQLAGCGLAGRAGAWEGCKGASAAGHAEGRSHDWPAPPLGRRVSHDQWCVQVVFSQGGARLKRCRRLEPRAEPHPLLRSGASEKCRTTSLIAGRMTNRAHIRVVSEVVKTLLLALRFRFLVGAVGGGCECGTLAR